jgi:hypothetical protein
MTQPVVCDQSAIGDGGFARAGRLQFWLLFLDRARRSAADTWRPGAI